MTDNTENDYPVGYRKPPLRSRFKAGQSGNSKGRPKKGAKSPLDQIIQELGAKIQVTENGKRQRMTKLEAIAKRLVNTALAGNSKAMDMLMKVIPILEQQHAVVISKTPQRITFSWLPAQPPVKEGANEIEK